jgi:hypothetical protein
MRESGQIFIWQLLDGRDFKRDEDAFHRAASAFSTVAPAALSSVFVVPPPSRDFGLAR